MKVRPAADVTPSTGANASGSAQREQRQSVERAELLGDLRRFRAGLLVSVPTWAAFGLLDWTVVRWEGAPSLAWFWTIRYGLLPVPLYAIWRSWRDPPPSRLHLWAMDALVYGIASFALALMTVRYGGITSSYLPGIMMVIIARDAFWAQQWKRALPLNLAMASSFPFVLGTAALFDPRIRAQLADPIARSTAVHYLFFIYGTVVLALAGAHYAWTLRRQLFESRSIGRYRLKHRIAGGGMGEVWAAYHAGLKRDVALKMLRPDAAHSETAVARFEREVKATTDLTHPNTVRVFDFGATDDGILYYAMELLDGVTFAQLVRSEGPLPPARAVHLMVQAARSLAEAHEHGIVHRDIKPANLFVTRAGGEPDFVKVLDFGIAKRYGEADAELTHTGEVAGTPKYMAPEVILERPATARSDVYGLGAVLYLLLTGRAPFEGESVKSIYVEKLTGDLARPSAVRGEALPAALEVIVMRCLAKDPSDRYAHAGDLADALADLGVVWTPPRRRSTVPPKAGPDDPTHAAG